MSHRTAPDVISTIHIVDTRRAQPERASLKARISARLRADRYDQQLAVGVPAPIGSALAVHAARLTTTHERDAIARSLERAAAAAQRAAEGRAVIPMRIPLHHKNIESAADVIDRILMLLDSPHPIGVRGMARIRAVPADGRGPMYFGGRGDLRGRLDAALAAL